MGVLEQLSDIINEDLIGAIETLGEWIEDLTTWLEESGRLSIAIKNATVIIGAYATGFGLVADEIDRTITKIKIIIEWLDKVPWDKIRQLLWVTGILGRGSIISGEQFPTVQSGGYIAQTGLAVVHRGEYITPANRVSNSYDNKEINVNISFEAIQISSDMDITRMAEKISREIRRELGMLF